EGRDNATQGRTHSNFEMWPPACGAGGCARTGETSCVEGELRDSCLPGEPGEEICDGVDNDCDRETDEDFVVHTTACGVGACAKTGETVCVEGRVLDSCLAGVPSAEVCDGADNDCDGTTDEDYVPLPTACGVGACARTGETVCVA